MSWSKSIGIGACLFIFSSIVFAESRDGFYWGLDGHYMMNSIGSEFTGDAEFKYSAAGLRAGYYLQPQLGIEAYGALGLDDDQDLGLDMRVQSIAGVLGRFESPETENNVKLFILLGYGMAELEMERSTSSVPDRELYHSAIYGGGVELRIGDSNSYVNLQGLRYYDEDSISLDGVSLGFRQSF